MKGKVPPYISLFLRKWKVTALNIPQRSAALLKCHVWELHDLSCRQAACVRPWNIHFDLLQGVIVERGGNHSYKESLAVTSTWVAWITEEEPYTKDQGNKVKQESKHGVITLAVGGASWQESLYL